VFIHFINGVLVYYIFLNILELRHFASKIPGRYPKVLALLSALLFVSHPIQVNSVTYVIQRTAALAATFYFLAVLNYLKFRIHDKARYFTLTLFFTILAMFTKENTITIPFLLALLEFMFFLKDGKTSWVKRLSFLLVLFMTVPIIPGTNLFIQGHSQSDPGVSFKASTDMDRFHYFYTQMNVILLYIRLLIFPVGQNFDYSNDFPLSTTIWENYSYISLAVLSIIGLIGILNIRKNKLVSLGIFWFYIGLAVESSFISIKDVYFEHRLYFPLVGFIMVLLGLVFVEYKRDRRLYLFRKPILYFVVMSFLLIPFYSTMTIYRNYIYSNSIRLWSDTVQKAPKNDRAHSVLATAYLDEYELDPDKHPDYLDKAEEEFILAIKMNNNNDTAHCNLSKVYYLKKDYEKSIEEANNTLKIVDSIYAYHNLGQAYKSLGKYDEAIQAFLSGYKLDSKSPFILKALGNTYVEINDFVNARTYYEEFLKYNTYSDSNEIKKKLEEIKNK
jgi:tetratricopeptide (TPR) repeat protein